MNTIKLSLLCRKIHRLCVLAIMVLGTAMLVTGTMMKYGLDGAGAARQLHNFLSPFFSVIFFIMLITGLVMYLQPWIMKQNRQQNNFP